MTYGPNFSRLPIGLAVVESGTRIWQHDEPLRVSNSEIQTFMTDRRSWYLSYYRGLQLKDKDAEISGPRSLGTRVHACLEHYYTSDYPAVSYLREIYDEAAQHFIDLNRGYEVDALWKEYDLAHAMIEGYIEWVEENAIDSELTVVEAEGVVEVDSHIEGVKLRGKMDQRVVRKTDNARLFRDFKTVGDFTRNTKTLYMNPQMRFYHMLEHLDSVQKTGSAPQWRTDGALYTMLRKVKRTATAKPPFYHQIEVRHNSSDIANTWKRTTKVIEEIFDTRNALDNGGDHQYWCPSRVDGNLAWSDLFPIYGLFDDGSNVEGMIEAYYQVGDPDARYNAEVSKGE